MPAPARLRGIFGDVIEVVVGSRIHIPGTSVRLIPQIVDRLKQACTYPNPKFETWQKFRFTPHPPNEFVKSWYREPKSGVSFARGMLDVVRKELHVRSLVGRVRFVDNTVKVEAPLLEWKGEPLWEFQERCVQSRLAGGPFLWRFPTGSGKTTMALAYVARAGRRALIVCPTVAIFDQWVERARRDLGVEPGVVRGKVRRVADVTIAMEHTLLRGVSDLVNEFGLILVDECQLCGNESYQKVLDSFPAEFRVGVSADEHRADKCEYLIYEQFGREVESVSKEELVKSGHVVDVEIRVVPTDFEAGWYKNLNPEQKFLKRASLVEEISADEERNQLIIKCVAKCLDEREQVMVLAKRVDHCLRIDSMATGYTRSVTLLGGDGGEAGFNASVDLFRRGVARVAVGTFAKVGIGFESHRELARGVFISPIAATEGGESQFNQFVGRYARAAAGKSRSIVYYMFDYRVFGDKPLKLLVKWFKNVSVCILGVGGVGHQLHDPKKWMKEMRKNVRDAKDGSEDRSTVDNNHDSDRGEPGRQTRFKRWGK